MFHPNDQQLLVRRDHATPHQLTQPSLKLQRPKTHQEDQESADALQIEVSTLR